MIKLIKFLKTYQADIILAIAVILISITSFNLGKISAHQQKKTPISITEPNSTNRLGTESGNAENFGLPNAKHPMLNAVSVVASRASKSKVYHFPWCAGVSSIADKNKITFTSEVAAISAGYTLASNCQK